MRRRHFVVGMNRINDWLTHFRRAVRSDKRIHSIQSLRICYPKQHKTFKGTAFQGPNSSGRPLTSFNIPNVLWEQ